MIDARAVSSWRRVELNRPGSPNRCTCTAHPPGRSEKPGEHLLHFPFFSPYICPYRLLLILGKNLVYQREVSPCTYPALHSIPPLNVPRSPIFWKTPVFSISPHVCNSPIAICTETRSICSVHITPACGRLLAGTPTLRRHGSMTAGGTIRRSPRAFLRSIDTARRRRAACKASSGWPCWWLVWC